MYDGTGTIFKDFDVPAGGVCGTKPCWRTGTTGFAYKNRAGTAQGVSSVGIKVSSDGLASPKLRAKGAALTLPSLPLIQSPDPVRVMMVNTSTSACWLSTFVAPAGSGSGGPDKWGDKGN